MDVYIQEQPVENMEPEQLEEMLCQLVESYIWIEAHLANIEHRPELPRSPDGPMTVTQYIDWQQRYVSARDEIAQMNKRTLQLNDEREEVETAIGRLIKGVHLLVPAFGAHYDVWAGLSPQRPSGVNVQVKNIQPLHGTEAEKEAKQL